jgi:hypothetical protein
VFLPGSPIHHRIIYIVQCFIWSQSQPSEFWVATLGPSGR